MPHNPPPPPIQRESTDLPVLQKITQAYKLWHAYLSHVPRLTRYSLGEKINLLFIELIELTIVATYSAREQKVQVIDKASIKLDLLKYFLQIAWELKAIDSKKMAQLTLPLAEAGRMLGGWKKQLINKTPSYN
jgi:hypothetical protein